MNARTGNGWGSLACCLTSGSDSRESSLVDTDLCFEAIQARNNAIISLIPAEQKRMVAAFVGTDAFEEIGHVFGPVMADILLASLPDMVHENGGQIAWAMRHGLRDEILNPLQRTVRADGRTLQVLRLGSVFLHFPEERAVVTADDAPAMTEPELCISVSSNGGSVRFWERWRRYAREHAYLRGQAFFADGQIIERKRSYTWDDIFLPAEAKGTIQTHVERFLQNRDQFKALGIKARRGILLAGPPGTGKTLLGKVLADIVDASFLWVSPRHIRDAGSFAGILDIARFVSPAIVFLEDLDLFAEERDSHGWSGLGELMNQLDGALDNEDIVTIATTNRLAVIEKALRNRPGRFDRIVKFEPMDAPCRRRLLTRLLAKAIITPCDMDHLVQAAEGYSGAQVEELANTLYILGAEDDHAVHANVAADDSVPVPGRMRMDRQLVDAAIEEVRVERKGRLGFHVA